MLFQYIGDSSAPEETTVFGYTFILRGEPVDITNPRIIEKLKGNGSFTEFSEIAKATELEMPTPEPKKEVIGTKELGRTFDIKVEEDLSDLTEEDLEKLTAPKKKSK